jgi:hypothetical protein
MLVDIKQGDVDISYTPKNGLIGSTNDFGSNNGEDLVSTNAYFPYNGGNSLINTFDWREVKWKVRYRNDNGTQSDTVLSPFYNNGAAFSGISAKYALNGDFIGGEDFSPMEGWELIKSNLGYNADGSAKSNAPNHPYVIMYDRVSGTLRVFVYTNNVGEANQLSISLEAKAGTPVNNQNYTPKLWGSLQQFSTLDQTQNSQYTKVTPFISTSGRLWYFSDFIMEYDPCINFFESNMKLKVAKITAGDLVMIGRLEGGSIPAGTAESNAWKEHREDFLTGVMDNNFNSLENTLGDITFNQYENYDLLHFKDEVSGQLEGKRIEDWEKEKAKMEWEATQQTGIATIVSGKAQIASGVAQIAAGTSEMAGGFGGWANSAIGGAATIAQGMATIVQGGATITSGHATLKMASAKKLYYDAIKDKVKRGDQNITMKVPPPRPHVVFGELALKGSLTITTTLIENEYVATPGGQNSDTSPEWYQNGSRGAQPLYNKPLGKFNMLHQPKFGVAIVGKESGTAHLKIKHKPYFAMNNTILGTIGHIPSVSIHVETLDTSGKVKRSSTLGGAYSTLFNTAGSNPLPSHMDISQHIDWEQLGININSLGANPSQQDIQNKLQDWIRVSYEVFSLSLTNLKSRDLGRVMANDKVYYTGDSSFAYANDGKAIDLANQHFSDYNFSDVSNFGNTYNLYHTDYDASGDAFYTAMNTYCNSLATTISSRESQEDVVPERFEENPIGETLGLTVYPNPAKNSVNFTLNTQDTGQASIMLYDLTGRQLIMATEQLNGRDLLQGELTINSLPAGIYILKIQLQNGASFTKKIIKK